MTAASWRKRGLQALMAIALLACVARYVDARGVMNALGAISLKDIGVLVVLSGVLVSISVAKWRLFLRQLRIEASFLHLTRLYVVGYFFNVFTPSFIGGDVVRSLYVGPSVDRAHAVSATFLERYTGIVAMLAISVVAVIASDIVTPQIRLAVVMLSIGCALGTWILFSGVLSRLARRARLPSQITVVCDRIHEGLVWGSRDRVLLVRALVLSLVFHLCTVINTAAVGYAVGWMNIPWQGLMVVVPLILLVGAIPISPQGLGIQEGAFLFFLHAVGASTDQALAVALILRVKSYVLAMLGGALFIGLPRFASQPQADASVGTGVKE